MEPFTRRAVRDIQAYDGPHTLPGIRFRFAREALGVGAWGMSVIELDPQTTCCPSHDHADDGHEEVYVVLEGEVLLRTSAGDVRLGQGDLVRVSPETGRQLVTAERGAVVLALGGIPGQPYRPSMGRLATW